MFLKPKTMIVFAVFLTAISFMEMNLWIALIMLWFVIGFFIVKKNYLKNLDPNQLKLWIFIFYGYPLIETIIKIFIYFNIIPYSYDALNIAEHAFWAICMSIYLLPFFKPKSNFGLIHAIALLGIVILIGNINEFVELAVRMIVFRKTTADYWSLTYFDTMRDLLMNIVGSCLGGGILHAKDRIIH